MERRIKTFVPISEITFDEELYPRAGYNWQTGYSYSQALLTGAIFPPITLALFKGKKILVDGKHRLEAHKIIKKENIEAEVFTGWGISKIYEEAVKRNMAHGRVLSPFEKRMIALKLKNMKYDLSQISSIIQIPLDKLENFIAQRLINSITGETIKEVVIKSELKHLAGKQYNLTEMNSIEQVQEPMYQTNQVDLLNSLISLIENKLLDLKDPEVNVRFEYLKNLIKT